MAIQTKVASLGSSPINADLLNKMLAAQSQATNLYGEVPAPVEDPRETVQRQVEQYMPRPMDVVPAPAVVDQPQIVDFQDVATGMGSQFGSRPVNEPVLDESGMPVINEETGSPLMRTISPQNYNEQLGLEQQSQQNINQAMGGLNEDPYGNAKEALSLLQQGNQATLSNANARIQERNTLSQDEMDRYADKTATALGQITSQARSALFTADARIKSPVQVGDGTTVPIATGIKAALESGYSDPNDIASIGTVFGLALTKAATQAPMEKGESTNNKVTSESGSVVDDADYLNNTINSVRHFARNGLDRMGIKLTPQAVNEMSKAMVLDAIDRGDMIVFHDKTGRPVVQVNKQFKNTSKQLQQASEIVVGDYNRRRSSTTPARSGTSFTAGKQQFTRKSLNKNGIVTTAAEATKDILGSIGFMFNPKDIAYKEVETSLMLQDQYLVKDPNSGEVMYSTHWAANRNGISQKDYDSAKLKVSPPENMDLNDPEQNRIFELRKEAQAREVIDLKIKQLQNDIANAKQSPGIRYSEWIHSLANQRFFPNNFDTDYMGSKNGIRDMISFANKDVTNPSMLFDPVTVSKLKEKAISILRSPGKKQNEELAKLSPAERGAIGTMINAVINYYSAVGSNNPDIVKEPPASLVNKYTVDIANKLAEVGNEYNQFLKDPVNATENIQSLLAGMEKGEAMGSKNLWDDMNTLKLAFDAKVKTYVPLTHHSFDDGNQNGIFLQSLFFGNTDNAIRLGTFNPSLDDMREFATSTMIANLEEQLKDQDDRNDAFRQFFKAIRDKYGKASIAKEIFKKPLMQNAYGKDASMFGDMMIDILADVYPEESQQYLQPHYNGDLNKAAADLNNALESTLREVVNSDGTYMLKSIGRFTAIMNTTVMMEGVAGDTYIFTPVGLVPVNKNNDTGETVELSLPSGDKVLVKYKQSEADIFQTPSGEVLVSTEGMDYNPSATKGMQKFYNKYTKSYDEFNNALGTSQMRLMVVMPIQSIDGDLVKMTTLAVNKDRNIPVPVMWVHDSIISSPGGALIYRNAYNNIAIPNAIPQIAKFGKKFKQVVDDAFNNEVERVMAKGQPVGIGEQGDYPAMGAFFDEQWDRIQEGNPYKEIFMSRKYNNEVKWEKFKSKIDSLLNVARENGWKAPNEVRGTENKSAKDILAHLAVTPKQFKELAKLAQEMLQLGGPENKLNSWVNNFEKNVNKTASQLMTASKRDGIGQMTYGATGTRINLKEPKQVEIKPRRKVEDPFAQVPTIKPPVISAKLPKGVRDISNEDNPF